VPALFYMVVGTMVEWIPALRLEDVDWILTMFFPIVLCNAFQVLRLHHLTQSNSVGGEQLAN
ncbi:MAG: KinB-signaling pathway activation protein, partial [Bacilli bacterium]